MPETLLGDAAQPPPPGAPRTAARLCPAHSRLLHTKVDHESSVKRKRIEETYVIGAHTDDIPEMTCQSLQTPRQR
jgi:hypothetical protein